MIKEVKKGFALPFLLILASTALIIGTFFLLDNKAKPSNRNSTASSSPEIDISNWKTYKNESLGFALQYPNNFWISNSTQSTPPADISFIFEDKQFIVSVSDRSEYKYKYMDKDPIKSLDDYAKEFTTACECKINKKNINDEKALEIIYGNGKDIVHVGTEPDIYRGPRDYVFWRQGKFYRIEYFTDDEQFMKTFDQILSTFKFVE